MPIPHLDATGLLPAGRHPCTPDEIEERLVTPFAGLSSTRLSLFTRWRQRRTEILQVVPSVEWLNGSFVEGKVSPNDIDSVAVIDLHDFEALNVTARRALAPLLLNQAGAKATWSVDSYVALVPYAGATNEQAMRDQLSYWERQWGSTRSGQPKGFLEVA